MSSVFEIENLSCAYKGSSNIVLQIDKLLVPEKQIVAILGISGVGKSTLLETLGLMNNTLRVSDNTKFDFYPDNNSKIDLVDIWKKPDKEISYIRNRYFSFIFQDTNLMPNFSIYENICLTLMLQGYSNKQAEELTDQYLKKIGLGEVKKDQKIYELSGGQRQRVAFLRAIAPSFRVIFGDEPTGNLDKITSGILMDLLYQGIKDQESTAVIVSHDVDLSIKYADQIILINKHFNHEGSFASSYGVINDELIFQRSKENNSLWISHSGEEIDSSNLNILVREKLASSNKETFIVD
jgi:ABC-type lipoprotein export system ATPase subunit